MKQTFLSVMKYALLLLVLSCTWQNSAYAATKTWTGTSATGAWSTGTNWSGGTAPVAGDDVTIGGTATTTWNNIPTISFNSLTISGTSNLTFSNAAQVTITVTGTLTVNNTITTGSNVSITLPSGATGTIKSGEVLTMGGTNANLIVGGTLTANGSSNRPLATSKAIQILSGGLIDFKGTSVSGVLASAGIIVASGGELRFSGSGNPGLGYYTINSGALLTIGGAVGNGTGVANTTYPTYQAGSTLQYTGTSAQVANTYELPSGTGGVTNVIINNASGVTFNTSVSPSPTITGTLTLTSGTLKLTGTNFPSITFADGNTPIVKGGGSIDPGTTASLKFTGSGSAFTLPANLFTNSTYLYRLTVTRTNPLTLNAQNITGYWFELNSGQVILGAGNYTCSSILTTGTFGTSTMAVTSSTSGYFNFAFSATDTFTRTLPLGELVGTAEYTPAIVKMNATSVARTVGFRLVDASHPNINSPTAAQDYISRYFNTVVSPSTGTYNYNASLFYTTPDVVGIEANIVPVANNSGWVVYPGSVNTVTHNLDINGGDETTAPFGFDLTGRTGMAAFPAPVATAGSNAGCTQITANWNASAGATGYYLDVSTDANFSTFLAGFNNQPVGNLTSYTITNLIPGVTYYYRVRATDLTQTSANSNTITYTTLFTPAAPAATNATNVTCGTFQANWNSSPGATGYFLDVSDNSAFTSFFSTYSNLPVGNITSYTVGIVASGTTYYYRVRATSTCGTSANSNTITTVSLVTPTTPTAVAGTGATCSQITANWNAASNTTTYLLDVSTNNAFSSFVSGYNGLNVGAVTTYNVTSLSAGTTYYYRVRAANNCDTTANSNTITYATITAPTAPTFTAGATSLCLGSTSTYTATSTGTTVTYSIQSGTGATINATTGVVSNVTGNFTVVATATNVCNTATATRAVTVTSPPTINVSNNGPICAGTNLQLTATGGTFYNWSGPNGFSNTATGTPTITAATVAATGTYNVTVSDANGCSVTGSTNVIVNASVVPTVTIAASPIGIICSGTSVTFTATSQNSGANPTYQWLVNGIGAGSGATLTRSNLGDGDSVRCVLTSNAACALPASVSSNTITMSVSNSVTPSVSISYQSGAICASSNVVFTANPIGGGNNPTYAWTVNGNSAGSGSTLSRSNLANGDVVSITLTSNSGCATVPTATANITISTVVTSVTPAVSISATPNTAVCAGTNIAFTASATNGGTNPTYQWFVNGTLSGSTASFSSSAMNNGDSVKAVLTSNEACASTATATSAPFYVVLSTPVTPNVTIAANPAGAICAGGTSVTFTPTSTNGGTNPTYQWLINNVNVATGATYTSSTLNNGDKVSAILISNAGCVTSAQANSNEITMSVSSTLTPSVSIVADPNYIFCSGSNVIFRPTPSGGGSNPSYRWYVNGVLSGSSIAFTTNTLNNGDQVTVIMTSSASCASPDTAVSNSIAVTVPVTVTPSVSITSSPAGTVCSGTNVAFTAVPVNGGNPTYQWQVNGNNVDTNATFSSSALQDGDMVTLIITSDATCTTSRIATSNTITTSVTNSVTPSVTIASNPNGPICAGTDVAFTATPVNGGTPTYQWWVNGNNVDTGATYHSSTLFNNDQVKVIMTSSIVCATVRDTTSNIITMTVNSAPTPTITQNGNILTSSPARGYQWYRDTLVINGATNQSLTISQSGNYLVQVTDSNGCTSNSVLYSGTYTGINDISNEMQLIVYPNPASTELNISLSNVTGTGSADIVLFDAIGKMVISETKAVTSNTLIQLNTSALTQGLYLLQVKQGSNISKHKVVITK